jgi:hypothetical protein
LLVGCGLFAVALVLVTLGKRGPLTAYAALLFVLSFITGFSVGVFFLPGAAMLVLSATVLWLPVRRSTGRPAD